MVWCIVIWQVMYILVQTMALGIRLVLGLGDPSCGPYRRARLALGCDGIFFKGGVAGRRLKGRGDSKPDSANGYFRNRKQPQQPQEK